MTSSERIYNLITRLELVLQHTRYRAQLKKEPIERSLSRALIVQGATTNLHLYAKRRNLDPATLKKTESLQIDATLLVATLEKVSPQDLN